MSLAVLVLRYKEPGDRRWKVPGNITLREREIPLGVIADFRGAVHDGHRQPVHQVCRRPSAGVTFSAVFFVIFTYSERRVGT